MKYRFLGTLISALLTLGTAQATDVTVTYNGKKATVEQTVKDSVKVAVDGAKVSIESTYQAHKLSVRLTGQSNDGQLILKTAGKAKVKLHNLTLTSQEGAPLWLKNKKKVEIVAADGTENTLTITACNDTANHKSATIWAKDKLLLSGKGTLHVIATGDGCRGIKSKDDITIEDLTLNVTTTGNNLGEKPFSFGGGMPPFGGMSPEGNDSTQQGGFGRFGGGMPPFNPEDLPEEVKQKFEEMRKDFEEKMKNGEFPPFGGFGGMRNDSTRQGQGGFPPFGGMGSNEEGGQGGPMGGFGGKHKYISSTKGIASKGTITINSGNVTVRTNTPGAEGIEGKEGVILNGGNIDVIATDDAINANATIQFNGANVIVRSTTNDAVDANPQGGFFMPFGNANPTGEEQKKADPAIIITGGTIYAWSQIGAPEEGLDCDFSPIEITGGNVFSVGAGMGDMPSVPTQETAKQPTVLLVGINIVKDQPIHLYDSKGTPIHTITVPFSLQRSSSLVTTPKFEVGNTYTLKTQGYEKTFTLNENFTVVR